ncbi:carbohydrate porin [bacterium]|nr:carbohydrate porin [bacterium]
MDAWTRGARYAAALSIGAALLIGAGASIAQPVEVPPTWGGDFWSRPRLTGSWGGLRDDLARKGVVLDVDLLLTPQDVFSGGRNNDEGFWGNAEYTLNVDSDKLGLWPGGFFKVVGQSGFGSSVLSDVGALMPPNSAALLPEPNADASALLNATFAQFLSTKFGVFAGKIFTFDGSHGEFTGNYRTQFTNLGFAFPMALDLVPISAFGGGIIVLPWEGAVLSAMALDPSGTPADDDVGDAFDDGATVVASLKAKIEPFGLVGHQTVGGMWSDKSRLSLIQDPSNIVTLLANERFPRLQDPGPILTRVLERFFPGLLVPVQPANRDDSTWAVFYSFDQYFWQPDDDPKRGIGIFFHFGAADAETSPVEYSYAMGIGGNGVVPGRPRDTFGIGWLRVEFSDDLVPFLRQNLDLGLDHEDALEMYYNVSVTNWLSVSLDLQVIHTGLKKKLGSGNNLTDVDTAVVGGLRAYVRF